MIVVQSDRTVVDDAVVLAITYGGAVPEGDPETGMATLGALAERTGALVVALRDGESLTGLDEQAMGEAGWVPRSLTQRAVNAAESAADGYAATVDALAAIHDLLDEFPEQVPTMRVRMLIAGLATDERSETDEP